MAIFLTEKTKVIVQGITGSEGSKHTRRMILSGTNIVGGVTPGKDRRDAGCLRAARGAPSHRWSVRDALRTCGGQHRHPARVALPGVPQSGLGNIGCEARCLFEHHRPPAIEEDPSLKVQLHRPRQHARLGVAALRRHHIRLVDMRRRLHRLCDDRALVEIAGHIMRRRADQLHAAIEGLRVGLCALEARQEGVVDVYTLAGKRRAHLGREDLHVTR